MKPVASIESLGLDERSPSEIVLTTFLPNWVPYASTIGVRARGGSVLLEVFTDTQTFKNLVERGAAVINFVGDARLLARLALKKLLGFDPTKLSYTKSTRVDAPKLDGAEAHVEIEVKSLDRKEISDELGTSEVAEILAEVRGVEILNPRVRPLKRAESFVIESAVLASRVAEAVRRGKREVAERLFGELGAYRKRCETLAPSSDDTRLITEIIDALGR